MPTIRDTLMEITKSVSHLSRRVRSLETSQPSYGGSASGTRLAEDAQITSTTFRVTSLPHGEPTNGIFMVIDPYTSQCEVRRVSAFVGRSVTVSEGLSYGHSRGDAVLWVDNYEINVRWFGAVGDGTTEDYTAVQNAINAVNEFTGTHDGLARYITVYFPPGDYKCSTSIDLTNKRYFTIRGEGWAQSIISSYATGKPALDMLGARFFDLRDFTIYGNSASTPSCAISWGRTAASPNCGNCFIEDLCLDGKFSSAALYNVSSEVFSIKGLRSGPNYLDTPYVYYQTDTNVLSITSDYESISTTYTGASIFRFDDWWLTTKNGGYVTTLIYISSGSRFHGAFLRNLYANIYGGTGYLFHHCGASNELELCDIYGEGVYAGVMNFDGAQVAHFRFQNVKLNGFITQNSSYLAHGVLENCHNSTSGATITFERIDWCKLYQCWNFSNQLLVITDGDGNDIEWCNKANVTISAGYGNIIRDSSTSPRGFTVAALAIGTGSDITKFLKATASIDFGSINAGAVGSATVTVTGAAYGDLAMASPRTGIDTGLVIKQVVASTNTVTIYLYNYSAAPIDPAAQNWTVAVIA